MSSLTLYNSRSRRKEEFTPLEADRVGVYSCGPTVYSAQHIGNLRPYLFADLLKRALLAAGYEVTHVINITDVGHLTDDEDAGDDKMELAAQRSGRRAEEIAAEYTAQWQRDRRRVNCLEPEVLCRATEHIEQQIAMVQTLEEKGYTYRIEDGIYFDTSKFPRYADFGQLDLEAQAEHRRIDEVSAKRNPADFALWKFAAAEVQRQQEWDSPWGRGFPGWHIECSAMSSHYLGAPFDIHTGGVDHVKVHHSNEIAQSECALDLHPWVRFWMHNEFLDFRGEKMAKSLGNIYVLDDLVAKGFEPLAYRFFFLQTHYRKQQTYTDEAMQAAATGYRRLRSQTLALRDASGEVSEARIAAPRERFQAAVNDDLNAPRALAVATEVVRDESLKPAERRALLEEFDAWLGLDLLTGELAVPETENDPRIDGLVAEREQARQDRNWGEADRLRDALLAEGVVVEDTPDGPRWKRS